MSVGFCPEHRSWFCPCVFPRMYGHDLEAWERRWQADDNGAGEESRALEAELHDEEALW